VIERQKGKSLPRIRADDRGSEPYDSAQISVISAISGEVFAFPTTRDHGDYGDHGDSFPLTFHSKLSLYCIASALSGGGHK